MWSLWDFETSIFFFIPRIIALTYDFYQIVFCKYDRLSLIAVTLTVITLSNCYIKIKALNLVDRRNVPFELFQSIFSYLIQSHFPTFMCCDNKFAFGKSHKDIFRPFGNFLIFLRGFNNFPKSLESTLTTI